MCAVQALERKDRAAILRRGHASYWGSTHELHLGSDYNTYQVFSTVDGRGRLSLANVCAVQALEKGPTDYFATRACKLLGCYQLQLGNEHEDSEGSQGCGEKIRLHTCSKGSIRAEG